SNEVEILRNREAGLGKSIVLDDYFNHETKKDAAGRMVSWHYKWDELPNSGFSFFGHLFESLGARTQTLSDAPTIANLRNADVYIIVDPDTPEESKDPHYVQPEDVKAITEWVRDGGVLVLMNNDIGNAEFDHFNTLASVFGIEFDKVSKNRVQG